MKRTSHLLEIEKKNYYGALTFDIINAVSGSEVEILFSRHQVRIHNSGSGNTYVALRNRTHWSVSWGLSPWAEFQIRNEGGVIIICLHNNL